MVDKQKHTTQESVAVKRPLTLSGTVLSTAMNKTIVVRVENKFKHPVVGKIVSTFKKYKAHDEHEQAKVGDLVEIFECRPLSATKYMMFKHVLKHHHSNS